MDHITPKKIVAGILLTSLVAEVSFYLVKWTREWLKRRKLAKDGSAPFSKIIFFPDSRPTCMTLILEGSCNNRNCRFSHEDSSFLELMRYVLGAQTSVELCVFVITSKELGQAVLNLHRRGVKVRVVTDLEQVGASGSQVTSFVNEGIEVRHNSSYLMHHKFVIVDGQLLINGSFNWTRQAVNCNNENVLITTHMDLVSPYIKEFDKLWSEFKPADPTR